MYYIHFLGGEMTNHFRSFLSINKHISEFITKLLFDFNRICHSLYFQKRRNWQNLLSFYSFSLY